MVGAALPVTLQILEQEQIKNMGRPLPPPVQRSGLEPAAGRWTIEIDLQLTRRRRVHEIQDSTGQVLAHVQELGDLIEFLLEHNQNTVWLLDGAERFELTVKRSPVEPS